MRMLRMSAFVVGVLGITTAMGWAQGRVDPRTGLPLSTPLTLDPRTHLPRWENPNTRLPTDPRTGARFDPLTRRPIDPQADVVLDPHTGTVVDRKTGEPYRPMLEPPGFVSPSQPSGRQPAAQPPRR